MLRLALLRVSECLPLVSGAAALLVSGSVPLLLVSSYYRPGEWALFHFLCALVASAGSSLVNADSDLLPLVNRLCSAVRVGWIQL
jgi:hypothetical protein